MKIHREQYQESGDLTWYEDANCKGKGPDYMFPHNGVGVSLAKQICSNCVVKVECLDYALEHRIDYGVWGETSERERRRMLKNN